MTSTVTTEWAVAGSYFETCNCEAVCPCRSVGGRTGGRSTFGVCEFALSWHIEQGRRGDVDLDGLGVVLAGFYVDDQPGSPWSVVLYVDDRADDEQFASLGDVFLGRAGGTSLNNFAAAIAEVHGVRRASIELEHEPGLWGIGVEGHVRVEARETVPTDESVACGIPGMDHPGQELRAELMDVQDLPLSWSYRGRCGFATDFAYHS